MRICKKRGVTVAIVVTMVVVISILTATITVAVNNSINNSKLRGFATELNNVQIAVNSMINSGKITECVTKDITVNISGTEDFDSESVTDGKVILHVLDLASINMPNTVYGNGKEATDVYAISYDTGKVYYVKGFNSVDRVYYTLDTKLNSVLGEGGSVLDTQKIIYEANYTDYTNNPIQVKVKIPTSIDITRVTLTAPGVTVGSAVTSGGYNEILVNTENVIGNYAITIKYTKDSNEITETYNVTNFDNVAPTLTVGKQTNSNYITNVLVSDNVKLKTVKYVNKNYETLNISGKEKEYFKTNGTVLSDNRLPQSQYYVIYAEDYAGNILIKTESTMPRICGDVNLDGVIDAKDIELVSAYVAGSTTVELDKLAADVNSDDTVGESDERILTQYIEGEQVELNCKD